MMFRVENSARVLLFIFRCLKLFAIFSSVFQMSGGNEQSKKCTRVESYEVVVPTQVTEQEWVEVTKFCFKMKYNFRCKDRKLQYRSRTINVTQIQNKTIEECCPGYTPIDGDCIIADFCINGVCKNITTTTENSIDQSTTITSSTIDDSSTVNFTENLTTEFHDDTTTTDGESSTVKADEDLVDTSYFDQTENDQKIISTTSFNVAASSLLPIASSSSKSTDINVLHSATLEELIRAAIDKCHQHQSTEILNDTVAALCSKILTLYDNPLPPISSDNERGQTTDNILLASSESVNGTVLEDSKGTIILETQSNEETEVDRDTRENYSTSTTQLYEQKRNNELVSFSSPAPSSTWLTETKNSNYSSNKCENCNWNVDSSSTKQGEFLIVWMVIVAAMILLVACNTIVFGAIRYYKNRHQSKKLKIPLENIANL